MTKTLCLLRHTKALDAGPADPSKDHARGLALRGQKDGKSLAMFFAAEDIHVDRIYCSTAKRTRQTFDLIRTGLEKPPVSFQDSLYLAPCDELIAFMQTIPEPIKSAMIIGHNPGLHDLALMLIGRSGKNQAKMLDKLRTKLPTGGLCTLSFELAAWEKIGAGLATLTRFVRPRDLDQND